MADLNESKSTHQKIHTNEISIQVEIDPENDYFGNPSSRYSNCYQRNIELIPSHSHNVVKSNPSGIISSFRRNSITSSLSGSEDNLLKRIGKEDEKKSSEQNEMFGKRRSQSNELITQQQIRSRLKLLAEKQFGDKNSIYLKKKVNLVKSPSSYQVPNVFDPMINFSSKVLMKNPQKSQIKPTVYKKYQFGAFKKISSHNLSSAQSRFENFNQLKKKYFVRKQSNLS